MFNQKDKDFRKLIETQMKLQKVFSNLMFAGAAMLTFGTMVAFGISKIMESSMLGSMYMEDLKSSLELFGMKLGEVLTDALSPFIDKFIAWLDVVSQDEGIMSTIGAIILLGSGFLVIGGIASLTAGLVGSLINNFVIFAKWASTLALKAIGPLTAEMVGLGLTIAAIAAGFYLGWKFGRFLVDAFGDIGAKAAIIIGGLMAVAAVIALIALNVSIATAGFAALAGIAAFGGAMAVAGFTGLLGQAQTTEILPVAGRVGSFGETIGTGGGNTYIDYSSNDINVGEFNTMEEGEDELIRLRRELDEYHENSFGGAR